MVNLEDSSALTVAEISRTRRWWAHLTFTRFTLHRMFPESELDVLQNAIAAGERSHNAELRVVIEGRFTPYELLTGLSPQARALELFSSLRVWDTESNSGVLLYVLLAERAIELVADRGVHKLAGGETWEGVVNQLQEAFKAGNFASGMAAVIDELNGILTENFPVSDKQDRKRNELSDRPLLIL